MRITGPDIQSRNGHTTWSCQVESASGPERELWYRVSSENDHLLTDRLDAGLVALLIPAMQQGESIHAAGPISVELLRQVQTDYVHLVALLLGERPIKVIADDGQLGSSQASTGVATGFSAGIDSFCTIADHLEDGPDELRLTHLLFNDVGSHGPSGHERFQRRHDRLRSVAGRLGLPFVQVASNLDDFYTSGFQRTHTARNASVALLLQEGIGRWLYASAFPYQSVKLGPTYDMAYGDTVTLPFLSTSAIRLLSSGSQYTRVAKTMRVAEIPESYASLNVCVRSPEDKLNCSACWKCLRTLLTLEVGKVLDRYIAAFDLGTYERHREQFMASVLVSNDVLLREIVAFAREQGFKFPPSARARVPVELARTPAKRAHRIARQQARRFAPDWVRQRVKRRRS